MALISSIAAGNASNTAIWSGGVVPVQGDMVNIMHTVTLDGDYTWGNDTAYGINVGVSPTCTGNISGTTFTDTTHATTGPGLSQFVIGTYLVGSNILPGTKITGYGTGTGSNNGGTYTVNNSHTATGQQTIWGFPASGYCSFTATITNPNTLNVTAVASGTLGIDTILYTSALSLPIRITAMGTGTGGTGSYLLNLNGNQTLGSTAGIQGFNQTASLKASRTQNCSLTCYGGMTWVNRGSIDFGRVGDAIPAAYTAKIFLNKSAAMASVKYGMNSIQGATTGNAQQPHSGQCYFNGAAKTRNTSLNGSVAAGATTITVTDATGWMPGDYIYLGPVATNNIAAISCSDDVQIAASYTPGSTTVPIQDIAVCTGSISGTVFTDTTHTSGFFSVGMTLTGTGVTGGTVIANIAQAVTGGCGYDNGGLYSVNNSQNVGPITITGTYTGLRFAHPTGMVVSNRSCNVVVTSYEPKMRGWGFFTYGGFNLGNATSGGSYNNPGDYCENYVQFLNLGENQQSVTNYQGWQLLSSGIYSGSPVVVTPPMGPVYYSSCPLYCVPFMKYGNYNKVTYTNAFVGQSIIPTGGYMMALFSGLCVGFVNSVFAARSGIVSTGYSQGGQSCTFVGCDFISANGSASIMGSGLSWQITNCRFFGRGYVFNATALPGFNLTSCDIGYTFPMVTVASGQSTLIATGGYLNAVLTSVMSSCLFSQTQGWYYGLYPTTYIGLIEAASAFNVSLVNIQNDPTQQSLCTNTGWWFRENSVVNRGTSSIRSVPQRIGISNDFTMPFYAQSGVTYTVIGYVRKNSVYAGSVYPSLTVSGLGVTGTLTGSGTNVTDTWEKITLSFTQSSGAAGNVSIVFSASTTALGTLTAPALAYCDGVMFAPWVNVTRHYGYLFDLNAYRTVNPFLIDTEATVAAYTGFAINGATGAMSVTSSHTMQDLYEYSQWWACQPANLGYNPPLMTTDGVNFTSTYSLSIATGCTLTGTGSLNLGSQAFTLTGTADTDMVVTSAAGTRCKLTVSGFVTGSDVVIMTTATPDGSGSNVIQTYDAVSGTSVKYAYISAGATVNIGLYLSGYRPVVLKNITLGATNATLSVSQQADPSYA